MAGHWLDDWTDAHKPQVSTDDVALEQFVEGIENSAVAAAPVVLARLEALIESVDLGAISTVDAVRDVHRHLANVEELAGQLLAAQREANRLARRSWWAKARGAR